MSEQSCSRVPVWKERICLSRKAGHLPVAAAAAVFLFLLIIPLSRAGDQTVSRKHKAFYESGQAMNLTEVLDLKEVAEDWVITVTIQYNMVRSSLAVDWLYDDRVIGRSTLSQGMKQKASFTYDQPLPGEISVRFTGPAGKIQVRAVGAVVSTRGRKRISSGETVYGDKKPVDGEMAREEKTTPVPIATGLTLKRVVVPDLLGKTAKEAESMAENAGLRPAVEYMVSREKQHKGKEGRVISQSPAAEVVAVRGSTVQLRVYSPPSTGTVDQDGGVVGIVKTLAGPSFRINAYLEAPSGPDTYTIKVRFYENPGAHIDDDIFMLYKVLDERGVDVAKEAMVFAKNQFMAGPGGEFAWALIDLPFKRVSMRRSLEMKFFAALGQQMDEAAPETSTFSLALPDPPEIDLEVLANPFPPYQTVSAEGLASTVKIMKTGLGPVPSTVRLGWDVVNGPDTVLFSGELTVGPEDFAPEPQGMVEFTMVRVDVHSFYGRPGCKVVFKVDPAGELREWDEGNNSYAVSFGKCAALPQAETASDLVDILPEFDAAYVTGPDAQTHRAIKFKVVNKGPGILERPFRYYVVTRKRGTIDSVFRDRVDLTIPAGGEAFVEPPYDVQDSDYRAATGLEIGLDYDYLVAETDKTNNVGLFAFGLAEPGPETDPNALPDLSASLSSVEVVTSMNCTDALRKTVNPICYAAISGRLDNVGDVTAPRQGVGLALELTILDRDDAPLLVRSIHKPTAIGPHSNAVFQFESMPLEIYQKACTITLHADPDNLVLEADETNNTSVKALAFCGQDPALPDLSVTDITVRLVSGESLQYEIKAECENVGNEGALRSFSNKWIIDGHPIAFTDQPPLPHPAERFYYTLFHPAANLPPNQKTLQVRLELNDGQRLRGFDEIDRSNNIKEVVLDLPGR